MTGVVYVTDESILPILRSGHKTLFAPLRTDTIEAYDACTRAVVSNLPTLVVSHPATANHLASLNVAVSAGIFLYHFTRLRGPEAKPATSTT